MAVIDLGGDFAQTLADAGRPAIPEGTYLAVIEKVEDYLKPETGSYGFNWFLLVNTTPYDPANPSGWDTEGRVVPLKHYTWLGYKVNGKLTQTEKAYNAANMLAALGLTTGLLDTDDVKYRQVIVRVKHAPSRNDPDTLWPEVSKALRYRVDDKIAPVLAYLAEAAETPATPEAEAEPEF